MIAIKLAFKNLLGAGLRTWLNVSVLSFAFVLIIFYNGMIEGWNRQGRNDTQDWETGQGQFWHPEYDRYDFFTIRDSHARLSDEMLSLISVVIAGRLMCLRRNKIKNRKIMKGEFMFSPRRRRGINPIHPVIFVSDALLIFCSIR